MYLSEATKLGIPEDNTFHADKFFNDAVLRIKKQRFPVIKNYQYFSGFRMHKEIFFRKLSQVF